jgi:hypothetical protein
VYLRIVSKVFFNNTTKIQGYFFEFNRISIKSYIYLLHINKLLGLSVNSIKKAVSMLSQRLFLLNYRFYVFAKNTAFHSTSKERGAISLKFIFIRR